MTYVYTLSERGSSLYSWLSFAGKDLLLSTSYFSSAVFDSLPSLSAESSTVVPAQRLTYCAAVHPSAPIIYCKYLLCIFLSHYGITFWICAYGHAISSELRIHLFSPLSSFLDSLMSDFHHILDLAQILILFAMTSRMLPIAFYHHVASCYISSAVQSASRAALSFPLSIN